MAAYAQNRFHKRVLNANLNSTEILPTIKIIGCTSSTSARVYGSNHGITVGKLPSCITAIPGHPVGLPSQITSIPGHPAGLAQFHSDIPTTVNVGEKGHNPYHDQTSHTAITTRSENTTYKTANNSNFELLPEKQKILKKVRYLVLDQISQRQQPKF